MLASSLALIANQLANDVSNFPHFTFAGGISPLSFGPETVSFWFFAIIFDFLGHEDITPNQWPRKPAPPQAVLNVAMLAKE